MFGTTSDKLKRAVAANGPPLLVLSTNILMSDRFKNLPSHNPLRPNFGMKKKSPAVPDDLEDDNEEVDIDDLLIAPKTFQNHPLLGIGANKLSLLKATKDAEILRLKAQLRAAQLRLNFTNNNKGVLRTVGRTPMKSSQRNISGITRRVGGGVMLKQGKRSLALQSRDSAATFLIPRSPPRRNLIGKSPLKANGGKGLNYFGSPKTKDSLDDELDAYMKQSKGKKKTDLDKELDEYMLARAKAQALATGSDSSKPITSSSATVTTITTDETESPSKNTEEMPDSFTVTDADNLDIDIYEDLDSEMVMAEDDNADE